MKYNNKIDLNQINFHDQSFKSINIDFEEKKIEYSIDFYDENIADYINKKLYFEGIERFEFDGFKFSQFRDLTILSIDFTNKKNIFLCETKLIDDVDGVFTSIQFNFSNMVILP
jgi:hypothetical protein